MAITEYQRMKAGVWDFLERPKSPIAVSVQQLILALILISGVEFVLYTFIVDSLGGLDAVALVFRVMIIAVFTLEYLVRAWSAPSRIAYLTSVYGCIDLVAILPFYLTLGNAAFLRGVRFFGAWRETRICTAGFHSIRKARILGVGKLNRYFAPHGLAHILRENVLKNLLILFGLALSIPAIAYYVQSVNPSHYANILMVINVIGVAAMFANFAFTYKGTNPRKPLDRIFGHLTSGLLVLAIGVIFIISGKILSIEMGAASVVMDAVIWMVYSAIVLWDFWDAKKIGKDA